METIAVKHIIFWNIVFLLISSTASFADSTFSVFPQSLDLTLDEGETLVEEVSLTVNPVCIKAHEVDVISSDPSVLINNLTGIDSNGCGGDTSTFEIEFTGTATPLQFNLQFVDAGSVLATIPVSINPRPQLEALGGMLFTEYGIVFQVNSNGCTQKSDFEVVIMESYPMQLSLERVNPDPCDAYIPLGERIFFSYRELGVAPGSELMVVNPLGKLVVPFK
jgi:hypothetical protein